MGRAKTQVERNAFVRGLVTEASPLTYPENASLDEKNFVLNRDGSRQRRLGLDFENTASLLDTGYNSTQFPDSAINTFKWLNVNNDPALSFGVIQIGGRLWFVDLFKATLSINVKNSGNSFNLTRNNGATNINGFSQCQFAAIDGDLIVVSDELDNPIYIRYDESGDSFAQYDIDIEVRDIWGVRSLNAADLELLVDSRPNTLTTSHLYNLKNQGWKGDATEGDIKDFFDDESVYPSNADIAAFGKKDDGTFDSTLITISYLGTTPAPRGKFVISAFDRGADRNQVASLGAGALNDDRETGKITSVASYAGRIFYSGVESSVDDGDNRSPNYAGTIFYSQVIESGINLGRCYQDADPTSEDISDLVATDGGLIKIPEAGKIVRLVVSGATLVIIAENGIWQITGPDNVFKATEYSVSKVSNIGAISANSVVVAENIITYWADGGIYVLSPDQVSGALTAQNITETTIQTFYNDIPSVGRANAVGNFDASGRIITYLYNDTDTYDGINSKNTFNKELRFDLVLQAFYVYDIKEEETNSPYVAGYLPTELFNTTTHEIDVIVGSDAVQVNTDNVLITNVARSRGVSQTKYLTYKYNSVDNEYEFTFSEYINSGFKDLDSVDANAYLITGYEIFQDTQRNKAVNYLTTHFSRTEQEAIDQGGTIVPDNPSKCWIQAQWAFADSEAAMKFGSEFQAYRLRSSQIPTEAGDYDYGQSVITTKNKLRGNGKSLSLKFRTEEDNDCYILGWGLDVDGQTNV